MRAFVVVLLLAVAAGAAAQEQVTYRPPARDFAVRVHGEFVRYTDAGCVSTADSTVTVQSEPFTGAACTASKVRTRSQVVDAIDGGALER